MYVLGPVVHVLVRDGSRRNRLRGPQDRVEHRRILLQLRFLVNNRCGFVFRARVDEITPELLISVLQGDALAKRVLIEFFGSEAFGLMEVAVLDWRAVLADELAV